MKKIITSALVTILLLGTLTSCSEVSEEYFEHPIVEYVDKTFYTTEIKDFTSEDAKYLVEHPADPTPDALEISEDLLITTVDGIPQVSGTITNISEFDLQDVYIKFYLFSEDELRTPPTSGVPYIYWSLGEQFNAGETVEFLATSSPDHDSEDIEAIKSADYIALGGVGVDKWY